MKNIDSEVNTFHQKMASSMKSLLKAFTEGFEAMDRAKSDEVAQLKVEKAEREKKRVSKLSKIHSGISGLEALTSKLKLSFNDDAPKPEEKVEIHEDIHQEAQVNKTKKVDPPKNVTTTKTDVKKTEAPKNATKSAAPKTVALKKVATTETAKTTPKKVATTETAKTTPKKVAATAPAAFSAPPKKSNAVQATPAKKTPAAPTKKPASKKTTATSTPSKKSPAASK